MFGDIREMKEEIGKLKGFINRMIALGKVVNIDEEKALVRVELGEHDNVLSYWLPVLHHKTQHDKEYWLPDIDEFVLCLFFPPSFTRGIVIGAIYTEEDRPPANSRDKWVKRFKDGTVLEYDRKEHKLFIDVKGDLEIRVNNSQIKSITTHDGNLTINGDLKVNGNITASQNISDLNGVKGSLAELRNTFNNHTHKGDSGGNTSPPNQTVGG